MNPRDICPSAVNSMYHQLPLYVYLASNWKESPAFSVQKEVPAFRGLSVTSMVSVATAESWSNFFCPMPDLNPFALVYFGGIYPTWVPALPSYRTSSHPSSV